MRASRQMENDLVILLVGFALLVVLLLGWWTLSSTLISPMPWG